jgi:hypothetical protein
MERSRPRRRGPLARLFALLGGELFPGREPAPKPPAPRVRDVASEGVVTAGQGIGRTAAEATLILEQALAQVESMPKELAELKAALRGVLERLDEAMQHLGSEASRLSQEAANLAVVAERLEQHVGDLTQGLGGGAAEQPEASAPSTAGEPLFEAGDGALGIVLAAVPGFQGLMDAQRALSGLPSAIGASVVAFRNGEASLELHLQSPVSAREIVESVRRSTGHELLIEEARPDAARLRLRFVDGEGRG